MLQGRDEVETLRQKRTKLLGNGVEIRKFDKVFDKAICLRLRSRGSVSKSEL